VDEKQIVLLIQDAVNIKQNAGAMPPSIDVIIPTFNRALRVKRLVEGIAGKLKENDRICVVWQGSERPDIQETARIKLVYSSPVNLPKARNKGLAATTGGVVLFLDDDVEALDDRLLEAHRSIYSDEDIGAASGYIEDPLFDSRETLPSRYDETTGELVQNFSVGKSQYTFSLMGANMSIRRKALEQIKGFDENFIKNALWEDVDCAFRLRAAGWKIWYCADARVRHARDPLGGCRPKDPNLYCFHQFSNTAYFAVRYAPKTFYRTWFTYWKYRLEYISRKNIVWLKHDPVMVLMGILGACAGTVRFALCGKKSS
jgi:GT2 family glycosyltransferase